MSADRKILALGVALLLSSPAVAQTAPGWTFGQVPTPAQWNAVFAGKQDYLGAPPLLTTGGTMLGPLVTAASASPNAGFSIKPGVAPASPNNGDLWITSSGFFARVNGATVGPITAGTAGSFANTSPITVSFPSGVVTYACPTCAVTSAGNTFAAGQTITPASGATPAITIFTPTSTLGQGFNISQTGGGTAPLVAPFILGNFAYNGIMINDAVDSSATFGVVGGLVVQTNTAGATAQGFHGAGIFNANVNGVVPTDGTFGGVQGVSALAQSLYPMGGTGTGVGQAKGAIYAFGAIAIAYGPGGSWPGATNILNMTGLEINVGAKAGSSLSYKSGIQIANFADDVVQGALYDAALSISGQGGVGWRHGILFSRANSSNPVNAAGTLIGTLDSATVAHGVDLSNYTCSSDCYKSAGFVVDGAGGVASASFGHFGGGSGSTLSALTGANDGLRVGDGTVTGVVWSSAVFTRSVVAGTITAHNYVFLTNNQIAGYFDTSQQLNLGLSGTRGGVVILQGSASGAVTQSAQSAAGTPAVVWGTGGGTPAVAATSPLAIAAATGTITCATCVTSSGGGAISGTAPITVSAAGVVSLDAAGVTYAKIQNLGALAIMGRSANSSGVGADVQATAASDAVLRESGSTIGFGTVATAGIANNAVTLAKLAAQATNTVLGNAASGSAVPTALSVGTCSTSGSALIWTTNTGFGCNTSIAAATAATATTATNATNSAIADDTTTNATMNLTWVTTNTGNLPIKVTSTKLNFNPLSGNLAATLFNGNALSPGSWTLTGAASKTLTFSNTLTLAGTDGTTMTFPSTSATIARTDAGQTFTGTNAFGTLTATGGTHTGITSLGVRDTSAAFDVTIAATSSATLSAGRTLTLNVGNVAHTLALGTTANTITFPNLASYTVVTNGDTGTVTNAMLANSSLTVNGTAISLGASGTVTAAAGTLTGATLNSTVTASSLTSVGASLNVGGSSVTGRQLVVYGASQATFAFNDALGTATFKSMGLLYDGKNQTANAVLIMQNIGDTGTFVANSGAWFRDGAFTVGSITYPGEAGSLRVEAQHYQPNITTSSAAQTGTVCWTTGTGKFTVDTTVGCLTSVMGAKTITRRLDPGAALDMVSRLEPFAFRYKAGYGDGGRYEQFGLGAEEVALVDERIVGRDPEGNLQGVRYQELTAVLSGAVKALKADNDDLRENIRELRQNRR